MNFKNKLIIAFVFAVAMAFLETAVVVYLRYLFFPENGFLLPAKQTDAIIIITELGRELATIIMLWAVGYMLAQTKLSRLAWFLFCFAIWDIFYYIFLYVLLDWPAHILDWDILFLIPVAWYGPVLTPCLVALGMIGLALVIVSYEHKGAIRRLRKREWGSMAIGGAVILFTFIWPVINYMLQNHSELASIGNSRDINTTGNQSGMINDMIKASMTFIPTDYNWLLYFTGLFIFWGAILVYWRRLHHANMVVY